MITPALRHSAAAERNRAPILAALQRLLPGRGTALEVACGTGQHAEHFAAALPGWRWQPSDIDPGALASTSARATVGTGPGPRAPLALDVAADPWPLDPHSFDAVYCANLLHIAPWAACEGLMRGAARVLARDGVLIVYGPFRVDGIRTAPSNEAFDADLRARDPAWGLRCLADVQQAALVHGLQLRCREAMPANNLLVVFERMPPRQAPRRLQGRSATSVNPASGVFQVLRRSRVGSLSISTPLLRRQWNRERLPVPMEANE